MIKREINGTDIEVIYRFTAETAVEIFNENQECMPQLIAVTIAEVPGGVADIAIIDPRLVNSLQETEETKEALMTLIRLLLMRSAPPLFKAADRQPDAVVHISEAWALSTTTKRVHGEIEDHPERSEVIVINVHTRERTYVGVCPIANDGTKRVATFAPIFSGGKRTGRMIIHDDERGSHATH